jgi:hypothetical protein
MIINNFKAVALALAVLFSNMANAAFISVDEWHDTSDAYQGLKKANFADNIFYAVSLTGIFNNTDSYEMISGYRLATEADYTTAWANRDMINGEFLTDASVWPYYNQGGWAGYIWNGIARYQFLFEDSIITGISTHAGTREGYTYSWATNYMLSYTPNDPLAMNWAGFVLIKEEIQNSGSIPEPTTVAVFALGLLGLTSRKFKKQS